MEDLGPSVSRLSSAMMRLRPYSLVFQSQLASAPPGGPLRMGAQGKPWSQALHTLLTLYMFESVTAWSIC